MSRGRHPLVLGVVQAGGKGSRMDVLTRERAKPALPFAGVYQLVDFAISALVNSGVDDVWLSVQYRAGSLHGHVANGRPWDLDRTHGGLRWLVPEEGGSDWQGGFASGNADDLHRYVDAIDGHPAEVVAVASADQVWGTDLRPLVDRHVESGADCTVLTTEVSRKRAKDKTVVTTDGDRVTAVEEKPSRPSHGTIAAEVFLYRKDALVATLHELRRRRATTEGEDDLGDFSETLLPALVDEGTVLAAPLEGYWADCGTPSAYLLAHRDLIAGRVDVLTRADRPVLTRWPELPPARVRAGAVVEDAVLAPGADIGGTVRRSVIGPGVVVERGAVVEDAVLFDGVHVARDAEVGTAVLDDGVDVGARAVVGEVRRGGALPDDAVTLLGRDARAAAGARLDAGARLEPGGSA
ncbi:MAG: glucose-1-phosphate adenylyltransferase family protein [Phycicoccus sp.]